MFEDGHGEGLCPETQGRGRAGGQAREVGPQSQDAKVREEGRACTILAGGVFGRLALAWEELMAVAG